MITEIKSLEDHAQALKELDVLWETAVKGAQNGDRLDELILMIVMWERVNIVFPPFDETATPLEALLPEYQKR